MTLGRHCERSEAIQGQEESLDCVVAGAPCNDAGGPRKHGVIDRSGRHHARAATAQRIRRLAQSLFIVTNVMSFIRLLASRKLPSRVTDVLRTMLPPPGIAQLWNLSVLGSKRTT